MNTNLFFLEIFLGIWAEWMGNLDWMKSTNQPTNKQRNPKSEQWNQ